MACRSAHGMAWPHIGRWVPSTGCARPYMRPWLNYVRTITANRWLSRARLKRLRASASCRMAATTFLAALAKARDSDIRSVRAGCLVGACVCIRALIGGSGFAFEFGERLTTRGVGIRAGIEKRQDGG